MAKRQVPIQEFFLIKMNPVIRYLIIADIVGYGAAGLLGPIFAIFVVDFIQGGSVEVAGVAAGIYLLTKSIFQIPAAAIVDKICGDRDDFWFLVGGMTVVSLIPLAYLFVDTPLQLYIAQFVLGAATAFTFPSFMALFTRYIEKNKEGTVWGVYFTLVDVSSAATAAIGGVLAATIGFENVIIGVTVIGLIGTALYLPVGSALRRTPPCN